MKLKKLATAAVLSLVLALGLAPGLAQADDAAQQGGDQFAAAQLVTQAELADGTYKVPGLATKVLSMYHFDADSARVVIKGEKAWLVTSIDGAKEANTLKRFDGMAYGPQSKILDASDTTNKTLVADTPVATVLNCGTTRTFILPVEKSVIAAKGDIYYMIKYCAGYSDAHDGDWYKASGGDYSLGGYSLELESESTDLPAAVELTITNNTNMFKAVSASAVKNVDGSATVTFALSANGYQNLFKGTYEEAVANDTATANWIKGAKNADDKWQFTATLTADELGKDVPIVSISQDYYDKYTKGENTLARAFYPRQINVDLAKATMTTGDFTVTKELKVTNNVSMFSVKGATITTVGGPNSNNYSKTINLSMGSTSFSKAFVGSAAEAGAAEVSDPDSVAAFEEATEAAEGVKGVFALKTMWIKKAGDPTTVVNKAEKPFVSSFWSVKNKRYYERQFTLDEEAGTLTIDEWVDPEAATTVDALIKKIQAQTRTETTDADCAAAKAAWDALSDDDKKKVEQADYFADDTGDASKDDPLNADMIGKNEILVVSFGTSYNDSRVATIGGVEKALAKAYPSWSVRRAFTAQIIINHVQARDGEKIDNVQQAMERAVANGVQTLVVQPTHLMHGAEYDELKEAIDAYKDKMTIIYAEPLLGEVGEDAAVINADKKAVAEAVVAAACKDANYADADAAAKDGTAIVLMGHGTAHEASITYEQMQTQMDKLGYKNVFIGTVEGEPESTECKAVIAKVKAAGYKKVILRPLMVVAGDHANNDMADPDDEESWFSMFVADDAFTKDTVTCQIAGLGEIDAVQQLYVAHTAAVLPFQTTYPDVSADDWFYDYAYTATRMGIMTGYTDPETGKVTKFGAGDPMERCQVVTIMYRWTHPNVTTTTDKANFEDNKTTLTDNADKQYYTAAINWAFEEGIMTGDTDPTTGNPLGKVRPNDPISRQELATMLYRWRGASGEAGNGKWKDAPDSADVLDFAKQGIDWCYTNGIMTGDANTKKLNPADNTLREQGAKMLVVVCQLPEAEAAV